MKTLSEELAAHKERRNMPDVVVQARYLIPHSINHVVMKFIINEHSGNK